MAILVRTKPSGVLAIIPKYDLGSRQALYIIRYKLIVMGQNHSGRATGHQHPRGIDGRFELFNNHLVGFIPGVLSALGYFQAEGQ
jgi:hypothetical protein